MRKIDPNMGEGGGENSREMGAPETPAAPKAQLGYELEPIASGRLPIASGFPDWDLLPPQGVIRRPRRSA